MTAWTLPLSSAEAALENVGGKGANLARLARAGFPVPPGFFITTHAYRAFVQHNRLAAWIAEMGQSVRPDDPSSFERASVAIRHLFAQGSIPPEVTAEVRAAYVALQTPLSNGPSPVAVRSSATAEDLPDVSFAGQQETYLNVVGDTALLGAIVKCWGSLWTARAIGYRARNGIAPDAIALSVVVQAMVPSEASGVLFTADPLSGRRTETVIDATLGLGEALVSGQVEPDHYAVETATGRILSKRLGAKAVAIHGKAGGGVETMQVEASQQQALPDEQIVSLAGLGRRVADEYQFPQDIEWAWAGGELHLLQSRPITSLYPVPDGLAPEPLHVLFSFGAVQGLLDPMTPLGQDAIRFAVAGAASVLGYRVGYDSQGVFRLAGERVWIDVTPVVRNEFGRRAAFGALSFIEPSVGQALNTLVDDPRLAVQGRGLPPRTIVKLAPRLLPIVIRVVRYLLDPDGRRAQAIRETDAYLEELRARCAATTAGPREGGDRQARLAQRVALLRECSQAFPQAIPTLITGLIAGMASFNILRHFAASQLSRQDGADPGQRVLELTRGLPNNVTTEMDLRLWETARTIRADGAEAAHFQSTPAPQLAADYLAGQLPAGTQGAIVRFLDRYGSRGLGEIDFGRARWREDPTPLMQALQSYLRIDDERLAPDAVFKRGEQAAREALAQLEAAVRRTPGGALKVRVIRMLAGRLRALMGLRESPKFFIIRLMGLLRDGLLESGREFAEAGVLGRADDLFFLRLPELDELAQGAPRDWAALVAGRRAVFQREKLRKQIPRLLLSDGLAIYEGLSDGSMGSNANALVGDPVSPGVAEGLVHVVLDPHGTQLAPGEILVCPGTDPAWTPLFLAAGGLVTEVGGLMTHGSVVAREYGIPAVVGVDRATQRLRTGQRIRLDGSAGRIVLLSGEKLGP